MAYTPHQYITIADADELLGYVLPTAAITAWLGGSVSDAVKTKALVDASYYFDSLNWIGFKEERLQPYAWPRIGIPGQIEGFARDELAGTVVDYVNGKVPFEVGTALAIAAAHFAHEFLNDEVSEDALLQMGFKSVSVGSISVELMGESDAKATLPKLAERYLSSYLRPSGTGKAMGEFRFI